MSPEAIALLAAISYALFTVYGWFGLQYSTPLVATLISLSARTVTLWTAVFLTGGIPGFLFPALVVFIVLGIIGARSPARFVSSSVLWPSHGENKSQENS